MAGFNEALPVQPDATIATINALLGWVPAAVTFVMLAVLCAMNIEKDMDSMNAEKSRSGNLCLRLTDVQSQASG